MGVIVPGAAVAREVIQERVRQDAKWGEQDHPNGTGVEHERMADLARHGCEIAFRYGQGTWRHVLMEEVWEAMAEDDPFKLRAELIQVAAVAVAWVEAIDRKANP